MSGFIFSEVVQVEDKVIILKSSNGLQHFFLGDEVYRELVKASVSIGCEVVYKLTAKGFKVERIVDVDSLVKKRELVAEYRVAIKSLPKVPKGSSFDFYQKDAESKFKIAEGFLLSNPDLLIANDCCGRGLPSYSYSSLSRLHGFVMNKSLEERILKIPYLCKNALSMEVK